MPPPITLPMVPAITILALALTARAEILGTFRLTRCASPQSRFATHAPSLRSLRRRRPRAPRLRTELAVAHNFVRIALRARAAAAHPLPTRVVGVPRPCDLRSVMVEPLSERSARFAFQISDTIPSFTPTWMINYVVQNVTAPPPARKGACARAPFSASTSPRARLVHLACAL